MRPGPSHPLRVALADYRLALGSRAYRRLWLAAVISRTGDTLNFTALPLFVLGITHAPAPVGITVLSEGLGLILGGLLAQSIVDRMPARRLLVSLDVFRAVAAGLLAIFPTFPTAVAVSLLLGLGSASFSPLSNAIIPRLVSDRALVAANGLQWTAGVLLQLVAAPVAGLLVTAGAARLAFTLNAASFVASAFVLLGLPYLPRLHENPSSAWWQLPELLAAIPRFTILPPLLAMQALAALAVGATSALLVVLARNAYGLSGTGYGLWLSAIAAGALAGPLLVPLLARMPACQAVSGAYVIRGVGDIGLGLIGSGIGGGLLLGVYGVNTSSGMVAFQTMVQREIPDAIRGRAFALLDVVWQTGRLASISIGVGLAASMGIRALFILGGALLVGAGAVGFIGLSRAVGLKT
ncbi:MAG: MFS transporter [Candidatus Dormibacteraeota bacterium]|nr:MFS transporter [Candidatus Dormibacteraeota bacterium]